LKIIYVLKDIGCSGGGRIVYEHLNGLANRKHDCELVYLTGSSDWFGDILFKKSQFNSPEKIIKYLKDINCIKVATWWETAPWVKEGGGQFYFVQDIETSYSDDLEYKEKVLKTYHLGLTHITTNSFQYAALKYALGANAKRAGIAINHKIFRCLNNINKENFALYFYRDNYLKNPGMLEESLKIIEQSPFDIELYAYGQLKCPFASKTFINVDDIELNKIINKASMFISTSRHEGFNLTILEAMACGTPVITTRAIGNETFCVDGVNCLMIENSQELARAVGQLLIQPDLVKYLSDNGLKTAQSYKWDNVIDKLENIFKGGT